MKLNNIDKIAGDKVILVAELDSPLNMAVHQNVVEWRNEPSIKDKFYGDGDFALTSHVEWYLNMLRDTTKHLFFIQRRDNMKIIGTTGYMNYSAVNKSAEYAWLMIGDSNSKSGGYGKEAEYLMLHYVFNLLNLNKFYAEVLERNYLVVGLHTKMGFEAEGLFKQHIFKDGKYENVVRMGMTRDRFQKNENKLRKMVNV